MPSEVLTLNGRDTIITTCKDGSIVWEVDVIEYMDMDRAETIFGEDIMEIHFTKDNTNDIKTSDPVIGKYHSIGSGKYYIVSDDGIYYYKCKLDNSTFTKLNPNSIIQILTIYQDKYESYKMLKIIAK